MIRAHFDLTESPFSAEPLALLPQREVLDTLRVHCQQGGLCVIVGEPGTGKQERHQARALPARFAGAPRVSQGPVVSLDLNCPVAPPQRSIAGGTPFPGLEARLG